MSGELFTGVERAWAVCALVDHHAGQCVSQRAAALVHGLHVLVHPLLTLVRRERAPVARDLARVFLLLVALQRIDAVSRDEVALVAVVHLGAVHAQDVVAQRLAVGCSVVAETALLLRVGIMPVLTQRLLAFRGTEPTVAALELRSRQASDE